MLCCCELDVGRLGALDLEKCLVPGFFLPAKDGHGFEVLMNILGA